MEDVLTLVADGKHTILDEKVINYSFRQLEKKGAKISQIEWLSPNKACDIYATDIANDTKNRRETLSKIREKHRVDCTIQPVLHRKKRLMLCDMDSTIIQQECIDEIADKLGLKEKVGVITERAMSGELDFKDALRERVALLKGLPTSELDDVYQNHIRLTPGAKRLVATMRKHGCCCILVSGGFTFFTERVAEDAGFSEHYANTLETDEGKLSGTVKEPILDKEAKLHQLQAAKDKLRLDPEDTMAIGDGANDLPMLENAGLGIAFRAKRVVCDRIISQIHFTDLTTALYIQGYSDDECTDE